MQSNQDASEPAVRGEARVALQLDNDLFFSVKVADTLKHAGYVTRTVRSAEAFAGALAESQPAVALVHIGVRGLNWHEALTASRQAGVPVVAYGSHVDLAAQEEARALGATSVIANSKLAADLIGVVERALNRASRAVERVGGQERAEGFERDAEKA